MGMDSFPVGTRGMLKLQYKLVIVGFQSRRKESKGNSSGLLLLGNSQSLLDKRARKTRLILALETLNFQAVRFLN